MSDNRPATKRTSTARGEASRYLREVILPYDGDECIQWPFCRHKLGYGQVKIGGKRKQVSRYVCEVNLGPPPTPKHEAAHLCGNGHEGCCTKGHLVWKTKTENAADKRIHGTQTSGESHPAARLKAGDVDEIRALHRVVTQSVLAARFNVSAHHIGRIQRRMKWADHGVAGAE